MNFFTKTKFLIAVIILLSAVILAIFGSMGYHHLSTNQRAINEHREDHQPGRYMAKQLQLTSNQAKEFDSLRERFHSESIALISDSKDISRDIMEEIMSENPNIDKLKGLAEKYGKLQEQQKQLMINHLLDVKGKCSASQQENFKKFLRQMENHEKMDGRGKRRNNESR